MILITIILFSCLKTPLQAQTAGEVIASTIEAMGGLNAWQNIDYIKMTHAGHKYWLEQSENPNGPFITSYEVVEEIRGVWKRQLSRKESTNQFQSKKATTSKVTLNENRGIMKFGERSFPIPFQYRIGYDEWTRYAPERLIFESQNQVLSFEGETLIEGTPHFQVSYTINKLKRTLFINKHTRVLGQAEIETHLPYDIFNYPWGKFVTTIKFSLHWLYPGGIRYPAQWDVHKLGKPYKSITILDVDFSPKVDDTAFAMPAKLPATPDPVLVTDIKLKTSGIEEVAANIKTIPGQWYVGHIVQSDGILVIEGPISSGYNEQHLAFLKKQYPKKPIKAVFITSDAWPHIGGIRPFAADEIPIYTHKLNKEVIENVLSADHSLIPDAYELKKPKTKFKFIEKATLIDDATTPVMILPINGEGGERMIALYFPKQKALYASDLVQYNSRTQEFFSPQYLSELKRIVDSYKLEVKTVFAIHTSPMLWQKVLDSLKAQTK